MKQAIYIFILLLFFVSNETLINAGIPNEEETLYYNIIAYNGKEFSSTFCANISKDIFLLYNTDNFLNLNQSLIYKWEITDRYYLDYKKLNISIDRNLPGHIEVYKNDSLYTKIDPTFYVYYRNFNEYNEVEWKIFKGDDARKRYKQFIEAEEDYKELLKKYNLELIKFREDYNKNINKIAYLHKKGLQKKVEDLMKKVIEDAKKNYPKEPIRPKIMVPIPQFGNVIKLPEGSYEILYRLDNGEILQESEKRLHVFSMRRKDIVGYKIIPEDKWTKPIDLLYPGQVLYINGKADLFFQPKIENEYPELFINRLMDNQAKGNKNIWSWTIVKSIHNGTIEVASSSSFTKNKNNLIELPYFVENSKESRLGYKIIDFSKIYKNKKNLTPSFYGYKINLDKISDKTLYIHYLNNENKITSGSLRLIKIIRLNKLPYWIIMLVMLPIIYGTTFILIRNRRFIEK